MLLLYIQSFILINTDPYTISTEIICYRRIIGCDCGCDCYAEVMIILAKISKILISDFTNKEERERDARKINNGAAVGSPLIRDVSLIKWR